MRPREGQVTARAPRHAGPFAFSGLPRIGRSPPPRVQSNPNWRRAGRPMNTPASIEVPKPLWAVLTNRIDILTWKVDLLALAAREVKTRRVQAALRASGAPSIQP